MVRDAAIRVDRLGFETFCLAQNDKADRERHNLEEIFAGGSSLQKSSVTHGPPPAVDYLCNRRK